MLIGCGAARAQGFWALIEPRFGIRYQSRRCRAPFVVKRGRENQEGKKVAREKEGGGRGLRDAHSLRLRRGRNNSPCLRGRGQGMQMRTAEAGPGNVNISCRGLDKRVNTSWGGAGNANDNGEGGAMT